MAGEVQIGRIKLRRGKQRTLCLSILHEELGREAVLTQEEQANLVEAVLLMLEAKE